MHTQQTTADNKDKYRDHREVLEQSLDEIASDLEATIREAGFTIPVYIILRTSGDSLVTLATPDTPSDRDWLQIGNIACQVIGNKIGCKGLRAKELTCAVVNAKRIGAADTSDSRPENNQRDSD